ncbi:MAG: hypothetical protein HYZ72_02305 [Deltaproteobacteria bacterium]|nr:hypothetical protein [Deltaproteobacteria bacterium]
MARQLRLSDVWQFELAAMLSQIGCVALPPDILDKVYAGQSLSQDEQEMFNAHPKVASAFVAKIPRLESVACIIERLQQPLDVHSVADDLKKGDTTTLGAHMLEVALEFDRLVADGAPPKAVLAQMRGQPHHYLPSLLAALENIELEKAVRVIKTVRVRELTPFMILDEDVHAKNGSLLLTKGHQLTTSIIERLRNFARTAGVVEPFRVLVPRETAQSDPAGENRTGGLDRAA